ncbi:hypothetical protein BKH41_03650 [Helicobacter sp. 12S02232-10]|uniref:hypothetical protein n=1 Tax=Helicobacter sp. 12S02232-10 TaxID=1476197 RepID=UPI000BA58B8F|nr:hypothetical protein [Helicobacter sp. 12S02232-10]PAF49187.1 hypothetical protein BKH41_03650 [Helicobacter sp. 12S02232-10]
MKMKHFKKQNNQTEYLLCNLYQGYISEETFIVCFVPLIQKDSSTSMESFLKPTIEKTLNEYQFKDGVFVIEVKYKNNPAILMEVVLNRGKATQLVALL